MYFMYVFHFTNTTIYPPQIVKVNTKATLKVLAKEKIFPIYPQCKLENPKLLQQFYV